MEETVHALDYLHIIRRRKVWLITPIVLSIIVGIALVQVLPKEYEAFATIAVPAPVVSPAYINSSGPLDNQERLRALNQQLVSDKILSAVATDAGLIDPSGPGADEQRQRVVAGMRRAISVRLPQEVINANEPRRLDAFLIIYKDGDPGRAQRVADLLATRFIAENTKTRAERAEGTAEFIAEQLQAAQQRLVEYEGQLRVAKEAHMGELPEQTQANLATLAGLRQQYESMATNLRGEEDRLSMVERTIETLLRPPSDGTITRRPALDPETPEGQLALLERDLAAARARWTDRHPEVQRLEEEVAFAKKRVASSPTATAEDRRAAVLANDPVYKQAVAERDSRRQRIRDIQREQTDLQRDIALYQRRVETAPRVEQQLAAMVRDYDLERQHYAELKSKLQAAQISESVERTGVSEQFTLLYPANLPTIPTRPVPLRVMLLSVASGLAVGVGLTLLREYLDRSVRDVRGLRSEFDVPVLGEVARIQQR